MHKTIPVLGIVASGSNAGKTTLITQLIPVLAKRNIRVSVIKHAHHAFDIDHVGKDSYKIREAGAVQTLIASGKRWALMTEMHRLPEAPTEVNLADLIAQINTNYADLILIEGFKQAMIHQKPIPKIEVYRPSLDLPLLALIDSSIIAVASDADLTLSIPILNLNDIQQIADFIVLKIIQTKY
ncbi:molybdopterin-guanine dinucleotide biosynthesis protein B [Methylotenera versatilis]|uniref:molybdopterin-guanine dinucleotide biosynthesis protein B n=1 Tax=Methylotenera versatilis TaxID=1055487 RepID=UPI0006459194|nr:molybdopterin-guanine dinucleotide biosynthesis protein B [Methylotenera versatilis]